MKLGHFSSDPNMVAATDLCAGPSQPTSMSVTNSISQSGRDLRSGVGAESCELPCICKAKMALFSRIFPNRRSNRSLGGKWSAQDDNKKWSTPAFDKDSIRLVLYQEHDHTLIFDSKAVHRAPPHEQPGEFRKNCRFTLQKSAPKPPPPDSGLGLQLPKYTYTRPGSDVKMLGEMVFGSISMAYRGSTLKVHMIRTPHQLMVTKVFIPTINRSSSGEGESMENYSVQTPTSEARTNRANVADSIPVDVPISSKRPSITAETEDSGLSTSATSSASFSTPFPSPTSSVSSSFTSSYNSMHRRWMRNQTTSLEHNLMKRCSHDEGVSEPLPAAKRPRKYGLGILFTLPDEADEKQAEKARQFQNFFFSHITLIEGHVNRLRVTVEKAMLNKKAFVHFVVEGLESLRNSLLDLYTAPRLQEPVWLNMMSFTTHRVALCHRFLQELMSCVDKYDAKNTKFFISTLITAALTHHLAWVPTVTPVGATPARTYLDKHSAKWLDALAKSHPYNPLWAQLGDLYGAIGYPLRLSRTMVVGKRQELIMKILYILSYFIRCSEVLENIDEKFGGECYDEEMDRDEEFDSEMGMMGRFDRVSLESRSICSQKDRMSPMVVTQLSREDGTHSMMQRSGSDKSRTTSPSLTYQRKRHKSSSGFTSYIGKESSTPAEKKGTFVSYLNDDPGGPDKGSFVCYLEKEGVCCTDRTVPDRCDNCSSVEKGCQCSKTQCCCSRLSQPCSDVDGSAREKSDVPEDTSSTLTEACAKLNSSNLVCDPSHDHLSETFKPNSIDARHSSSPVRLKQTDQYIVGGDYESVKVVQSPCQLALSLAVTRPCKQDVHVSGDILPSGNNVCQDVIVDINEKSARDVPQNGSTGKLLSMDSGIFVDVAPPKVTDSQEPVNGAEGGFDSLLSGSSVLPSPDLTESPRSVESWLRRTLPFRRSTSKTDKSEAIGKSPDSTYDVIDFNDNFEQPRQQPVSSDVKSVPSPERAIRESSSAVISSGEEGSTMRDSTITVKEENVMSASDSSTINMDNSSLVGSKNCLCSRHADTETNVNESCDQVEVDRKPAERPATLVLGGRSKKSGGHSPWPWDPAGGGDRARQVTRQSSVSSLHNPARCRSVTPTELGRRRHTSTLSTASSLDFPEFLLTLKEVPMPVSETKEEVYNMQSFDRNFGRSLLAGYSDHYMSDFALHGTSDDAYIPRMHSDLTLAVQNPVLDEPIEEAVCIVADTDKWNVRLHSVHCTIPDRVKCSDVTASQFICDIIESVHNLWKLKMSPEFCLMHLEDRLQELYFRSKMLGDYVRFHRKIVPEDLVNKFECDASDLPLLLSVAGTHTPHLALALS